MPLELLRRLATLLLLLPGLALFVWPGGPYPCVSRVDFAAEQARSPYRSRADESLEAFVCRRTRDRTMDVPSSEVDRLLRFLEEGNPDVLQRIDDRAIVSPASLALTTSSALTYLQHPEQNLWLRIETLPASELRGLAPPLRHPFRHQGTFLLVLASFAYTLPPRRKPSPGELRYGRASSVVLPDLLGFALASLFFSLALLGFLHAPAGARQALTGIPLALSLFAVSLLFIATHYATLSFRLSENALLRSSDGRNQRFAWADMAECAPYSGRAAGRLGLLLILFARGPGMMGQGLLVAGNVERGVEIRMKDGKRLRIMANSLAGFPEIIHALETHGVPGHETLGTRTA